MIQSRLMLSDRYRVALALLFFSPAPLGATCTRFLKAKCQCQPDTLVNPERRATARAHPTYRRSRPGNSATSSAGAQRRRRIRHRLCRPVRAIRAWLDGVAPHDTGSTVTGTATRVRAVGYGLAGAAQP